MARRSGRGRCSKPGDMVADEIGLTHPRWRETPVGGGAGSAVCLGQRRGLALQPVTDRQDVIKGLMTTLKLPQLPSAGRVIALDREQVSLNLASVPPDEVLEFRATHGQQHRAYMHNLRRFVAELAGLDEQARERAFVDRREELADAADDLRRLARTHWRRPLASFGLGLAGVAWSAHQGDSPAALLQLGAGLLGLQGCPTPAARTPTCSLLSAGSAANDPVGRRRCGRPVG
jgi:hypothetical protein